MTITAKVIADSTSIDNIRIISVECRYPRFIHAELMTHRDFSRNSASSRAIPIQKMIADIKKDMAIPIFWGKNQKGMQAREELTGWRLWLAKFIWVSLGHFACFVAWILFQLGLHKQIANRILEPWSHITVLITSTNWANFFALRDHPDAQPEIQELAIRIKEAFENSTPILRKHNEWHLPYVYEHERTAGHSEVDLLRISMARCASTSYKTVDGKIMTLERAIELGAKLLDAVPMHASPAEHQATPDKRLKHGWSKENLHGNFEGWIQNRKMFPNEYVADVR